MLKVFKDLVFYPHKTGGIESRMNFDNGFSISVIAGKYKYSTPREDRKCSDEFSSFEVAVLSDDGQFTREFFPKDHDEIILTYQDRGQINSLMLLIQSKK